MSGVMTVIPTPPTPPTSEQILLRDHWLRTLAPEDRDLLDELPLREVDRRFEAWCEGRDPAEDAGPG